MKPVSIFIAIILLGALACCITDCARGETKHFHEAIVTGKSYKPAWYTTRIDEHGMPETTEHSEEFYIYVKHPEYSGRISVVTREQFATTKENDFVNLAIRYGHSGNIYWVTIEQ